MRRLLPLIVLALAAGPAQAQYGVSFGRNKIAYEHFQWHVLKTEHFDVYYYPEARTLAEMGAAIAESQVAELEQRFATSLNGRTPLIFYSSNIHFKQTNTTPGFIPDGVGGFFEFLKGRVVLPANGNLHGFRRVIRHELVHVFTFTKLLRVFLDHRTPTDRFLPLWFTEGLAEFWSGPPDYQHEMMLRDALASGYFVPLENLERIEGTYQMYKEGEAFFHFVREQYGEEKILLMIEESWRDRDFRHVLSRVLGEPYKTTSDRFSAWLKARYYPALRDAQLASAATPGIGVQGYAAKPAYYRRADGTRTVLYVGNRDGYASVFEATVDSAYYRTGKPKPLVRGERSNRFEAFHLFESRIDVAPTTGRLAFVTKSGETDVVHSYDLEHHRMEATYRFPRLVAVYSPTWNPDGTRLAFTGIERSGFADLYTYTPATSTLERVTNDAYDDRDPAWSPDGESLVFSSDRGAEGQQGFYTLFQYRFENGQITPLTHGRVMDLSPTWSPDGRHVAFVRAAQGEDGRYGAQDLWVLDVPTPVTLASRAALAPADLTADTPTLEDAPRARRVLGVTAAASDPAWTHDDVLLFGSFEHYRFTTRALRHVSARLREASAPPVLAARVGLADVAEGDAGEGSGRWAFPRYSAPSDTSGRGTPYRRRYALDFASGGVSQSPLYGTTGGAQLLFSDLLGDDLWYVSVYQTGQQDGGGSLLRSLNASVTRLQQGRRALIGYGLFRTAGLRYDLTDPDASSVYPIINETTYGALGLVSYPISMFQRVETSGSLAYSDKETIRTGQRKAILYAHTLALVHDNALYGYNGPIDGTRAGLTVGYTTDVRLSNVSYWTAMADVRKYWRLGRDLTFAQWGTARLNVGKEARYNLLGGAWDLRGLPFLSVRGAKLWHTSHELRFPILNAPSAYVPLLAPFGIANLRGALFADAAHAWNRGYDDEEAGLRTGVTWAALGGGLRLNLFGAIVLRYDVGYTYKDGARTSDRLFKKFFFGYDF